MSCKWFNIGITSYAPCNRAYLQEFRINYTICARRALKMNIFQGYALPCHKTNGEMNGSQMFSRYLGVQRK